MKGVVGTVSKKIVGNLSGKQSLTGGIVARGQDGFSPEVYVTEIEGGHQVDVTTKSGTKSFIVEDGEKGESGVSTPVSGFFTLAVDDNGDLWVYSEDEGAPEFEFDTETGALYVVQEV